MCCCAIYCLLNLMVIHSYIISWQKKWLTITLKHNWNFYMPQGIFFLFRIHLRQSGCLQHFKHFPEQFMWCGACYRNNIAGQASCSCYCSTILPNLFPFSSAYLSLHHTQSSAAVYKPSLLIHFSPAYCVIHYGRHSSKIVSHWRIYLSKSWAQNSLCAQNFVLQNQGYNSEYYTVARCSNLCMLCLPVKSRFIKVYTGKRVKIVKLKINLEVT